MPQFLRKSYKYICKGLGLANPPDLLPAGQFPILRNVLSAGEGVVSSRPPLALAASPAAASPVLSVRRLNDPTTGTYARIATDAAGHLISGTNALAIRDTGYSGNPTSLVPFRPLQSAAPWMYVGDSSRSRKINVAGINYLTGIVPPNQAPSIALGIPNYINIADFVTTAALASWTAGGTAGAPVSQNRFSTTISKILYDVGTTGWCSIVLATMDNNCQPGALIRLNSAEVVKIHDVFPAITTTTISAISYDTGTSGACSVVLTAPTVGLARDAVILLNAELVRILSVTVGPDGIPSLRTSTTGTHAVGETVTGYASLRAYTTVAHAAAETAVGVAIQSSIATGIGWVNFAGAYNLNTVGNRPITNDDYIHLSVLVDQPQNIVEGRFEIDISDGLFDANYFYYPFTQSNLQANALGTLTLLSSQQAALQQQIIQQNIETVTAVMQQHGPGVVPNLPLSQSPPQPGQSQGSGIQSVGAETVPGGSQWTELLIPMSSLIRVGSDQTKTLANVVAIRIQLNVTAAMVLLASSWWIGGTYGPDTGDLGTQLLSTYRYRSAAIGSRSNPAPATRAGVFARRERLVISGFQAPTDPQVDTIDVFVFGGNNNNWTLAASIPSAQTSANVDLTNAALTIGEALQFDNFVPFPTSDLPRAGTCNVVGTTILNTGGDAFNVRWSPGSQIIVGGLAYTLYDSPESTTRLQIVESAGAQSGVGFSVPEATLYGTPLPYQCDGGNLNSNVIFGAGDPNNPGILYWTNPSDPDTASDTHNIEVTSPSEPLYMPFTWNGQAYVYSPLRLFVLSPTAPTGNQRVGFIAQEVPSGKGLFAPWFSCVGSTPFFGSESSVNSWGGGASPSLTDDSLYPLFPQADVAGTAVNGYQPVDTGSPVALRLCWADSELYFLYADTGGVRRMMRYDFAHGGGWFPYDTTPAPYYVYEEEGGELESLLVGGANGGLYKFSTAGTETFTCQARTACLDLGDTRAQKLGTDAMLDCAGSFTLAILFDNFSSQVVSAASQGSRGQSQLALAANALTLWRNISLDAQWSGAGSLYEFQPAVELQPYLAPVVISQAVDHGIQGFAHLREGWYSVISAATVLVVVVVDGVPIPIAALPSTTGLYRKVYLPAPPVKGKLFLYKAYTSDGSAFVLYPDETTVNVKPWAGQGAYQPYKPFAGITNG